MSHHRSDHLSEPDGLAQLAQLRRSTRSSVPAATDATAAELCRQDVADVAASQFQFRLRTMLGLVAALCGLFAIMQFIGAVWSAILVWFLLLVIAHVTANFWGTRVAPRVGHQHLDESEPEARVALPARPTGAPAAVRLSESLRPGWPMLVATTVGAVVGGTLGSVALVLLSLDRAGYAGVVVGSVSAAAVGGFLGFLTSSFAEIALRAWKEAVSGVNDE